MTRPDVILVAGFPNSGTTIVSYLLGSHPEVFATGELYDFPNKQLKPGKLCSCGAAAMACEFWASVRTKVAALPPTATAGERTLAAYHAVAALIGGRVVLDVAQDLRSVTTFIEQPGLERRLIHLKRDGRAVLNSRLRRLDRQEHTLPSGPGARIRRAFHHARRWRAFEAGTSALGLQLGTATYPLTYERLCADPDGVLAEITAKFGVTSLRDRNEFLHLDRRSMSPPAHMIRGNARVRAQDTVTLELDREYVRELRLTDRLAYATAGLLQRVIRNVPGRLRRERKSRQTVP